MAVGAGGQAVTPRVVTEPRRWAAFHTSGVYSLLMGIQAAQEDLVGVLERGHLEMARQTARKIALMCLELRSLLHDGLPDDDGDVFANPFAGVPDEEVASALEAAAGVVRAADVASARSGIEAVDELVAALVRDLGYAGVPPSIRTPAGLYPALRTTRQLLPVNKEAHLPLVFEASWLTAP
jgi:hypothetical protein